MARANIRNPSWDAEQDRGTLPPVARARIGSTREDTRDFFEGES